jgi:hypothetical protein
MTIYPIRALLLVLFVLAIILLCVKRRKKEKREEERKLVTSLMKNEYGTLGKRVLRGSVFIDILHEENDHYKFVISNNGTIILRNIEIKLLLEAHEPNPLFPKEYQKKFPISRLNLGETVTLDATQYPTSPNVYNIRVRWTEPKSVRVEDQVYVKYKDDSIQI